VTAFSRSPQVSCVFHKDKSAGDQSNASTAFVALDGESKSGFPPIYRPISGSPFRVFLMAPSALASERYPDGSKCRVFGSGLKFALAGQLATFHISVADLNDRPALLDELSLTLLQTRAANCLSEEPKRSRISGGNGWVNMLGDFWNECSVDAPSDGRYRVRYTVNAAGSYFLRIQFSTVS
jgi:hypothetical protein